jgi:pilus assembly protein CpaE
MTQDLSPKIELLVLSDSRETADVLRSLLGGDSALNVNTSTAAFGEGVRAIVRLRPQVALVVDTLDHPAATVELLDSAAPDVPVIAVVGEGEVQALERCTLAGARVALLKPVDQAALTRAIQQVHQREMRRRQFVQAEDVGGQLHRPRIVAVHGSKGGAGATTLACNLAIALRQQTGGRVGFVDGNLMGGDSNVLFDLGNRGTRLTTIAEFLPHTRELDQKLVDTLLVEHESGVRVLLAPEQLQHAELIGGEDMQRVLIALRPYFDYLVVDTPAQSMPVLLAALDEADLAVLVVTPDLLALRNGARFLQLTTQLGFPNEKFLLVANRADGGGDITLERIAEHLQHPIDVGVPSDARTLLECLNSGTLAVTAKPQSRAARGIVEMAQQVVTRLESVRSVGRTASLPSAQDAPLAGGVPGRPAGAKPRFALLRRLGGGSGARTRPV